MTAKKRAILEALEQSLGVVTTACRAVGISRQTFYRWKDENEEFRAAVEDIDNITLDFAESQLFKQIKDGNTTATIFFLKTRGKDRGYVERQEHAGPGGQPLQITPILFKPQSDDADDQ